MPGFHFNSIKKIIYVTEYNLYNAYNNKNNKNIEEKSCSACSIQGYSPRAKNAIGAGSASGTTGTPRKLFNSQVIRNFRGGNIQFGDFYLGKPMNVNCLGKMEGMPGGSGSPPKNTF